MIQNGNTAQENFWANIEKAKAQNAAEIGKAKARIATLRLQLEMMRFERAKLVRAARRKRIVEDLRRAERRMKKSQN